ncbi:27908_t:CDS:2 [Dentiscutata erythropus]|uniref:27908_t:CDS:1 n=1 Tax=Dentiscutata erythropus TaxID=1348616 RepID=A0A9N9E758_9GLOM|nr:27908_t:CDS:2 [Dentiscutata erythropus]
MQVDEESVRPVPTIRKLKVKKQPLFEEEELEEYETYYSEEFELDSEEEKIVIKDDNLAIYLTEVNPIVLSKNNKDSWA